MFITLFVSGVFRGLIPIAIISMLAFVSYKYLGKKKIINFYKGVIFLFSLIIFALYYSFRGAVVTETEQGLMMCWFTIATAYMVYKKFGISLSE